MNYGDQAGVVVCALRALGHEAELWEVGRSRFAFPADRSIDLDGADPNALWRTFMEAVERFDVFHFHFAQSFFRHDWSLLPPFWDLPVLRMLGKQVFFTFHGSDCRTPSAHAARVPYSGEFFAEGTPDADAIAKRIQIIRTYANAMLAVSTELLWYVPDAEVVPRALELDAWPEIPYPGRERPLVVHAPTRRSYKGTPRILAALDQLEREGVAFDLSLVEDRPHDFVQREIQRADVVIDQCLMGDLGVVALEAMATGRPAAAYLAEDVGLALGDTPLFEIEPPTLVDRLRSLLTDLPLRRGLAAAGRGYVAKVHDSRTIAERHLELYATHDAAFTVRSMPDWTGFGDRRRIEQLEERIADAEAARGEARQNAREAVRVASWLRRERERLQEELRHPLTVLRRDLKRRLSRDRPVRSDG